MSFHPPLNNIQLDNMPLIFYLFDTFSNLFPYKNHWRKKKPITKLILSSNQDPKAIILQFQRLIIYNKTCFFDTRKKTTENSVTWRKLMFTFKYKQPALYSNVNFLNTKRCRNVFHLNYFFKKTNPITWSTHFCRVVLFQLFHLSHFGCGKVH